MFPAVTALLLCFAIPLAGSAVTARQAADGDWPQILGPGRDGVIRDQQIAGQWPTDGPPILWHKTVGEGFAGPAVVGGRLILFHRVGDEEAVEALDSGSGESLWRTAYSTSYRDDFGFDEGPRAVPTVADGRVFTCGAQGVLQAVDLQSGERLWSVATHDRFRVRKGFFGAACSPLVHDGKVIVNVGGRDGAGIVAFDAATGDILWTATDHEASYSAPTIAPIGGAPRALVFTRTGLVVLDPQSGDIWAEFPWRSRLGASVNAATPLVIDNRVFLSASYGVGAVLLDATTPTLQPLWSSDDALTNHYATSVRYQGFLYGYHGRQEYRPSLRAVELATGDVAWSVDAFGGGAILLADDKLLVLNENGELFLAPASTEGFMPTAWARILAATVRAYPAVAGGVLYARNQRELVAVDLR